MAPPKAAIPSTGPSAMQTTSVTTAVPAMVTRRSTRILLQKDKHIDREVENSRTRSKPTTRKPKPKAEVGKAVTKKKPAAGKSKYAETPEPTEESEAEASAPPPDTKQGRKRGVKQTGPPPKKQKVTEFKGKKTAPAKVKQAANVSKKRGRVSDEDEEDSAAITKVTAKKRKTAIKATSKTGNKAKETSKNQADVDEQAEVDAEEPDIDSDLPVLPEYDPDQVANGQTEEGQAGYNTSVSADIPNVTIPLGSKFRIEPVEIEHTAAGEFACSCPAFRKSSRTIKTCKHLFLLNGHQYEQKRYNDAQSQDAHEGASAPALNDIDPQQEENRTSAGGGQATKGQGSDTQGLQPPKDLTISEDQSIATVDEPKVD
ncbi:hypothetical protein AA313_de0206722 [Arthrobotrys entomopaga]|nr:hypothetical protein AA313_de0206722 [Arthrobotrys entomopaga]